jgi:hypothetical protein
MCGEPEQDTCRSAQGSGTTLPTHDGEYDFRADFEASINEGYAAIRARVAAGGPGWERN